MSHGRPDVLAFYAARAERGERTPLDDEPEIDGGSEWLWAAFVELSACRMRVGDHPQPISPSDALAWSRIRGLSRESTAVLWATIRVLDSAWIARTEIDIRTAVEAERARAAARAAAPRRGR